MEPFIKLLGKDFPAFQTRIQAKRAPLVAFRPRLQEEVCEIARMGEDWIDDDFTNKVIYTNAYGEGPSWVSVQTMIRGLCHWQVKVQQRKSARRIIKPAQSAGAHAEAGQWAFRSTENGFMLIPHQHFALLAVGGGLPLLLHPKKKDSPGKVERLQGAVGASRSDTPSSPFSSPYELPRVRGVRDRTPFAARLAIDIAREEAMTPVSSTPGASPMASCKHTPSSVRSSVKRNLQPILNRVFAAIRAANASASGLLSKTKISAKQKGSSPVATRTAALTSTSSSPSLIRSAGASVQQSTTPPEEMLRSNETSTSLSLSSGVPARRLSVGLNCRRWI